MSLNLYEFFSGFLGVMFAAYAFGRNLQARERNRREKEKYTKYAERVIQRSSPPNVRFYGGFIVPGYATPRQEDFDFEYVDVDDRAPFVAELRRFATKDPR